MWFLDYITENFVMLSELIGLIILVQLSVHVPQRTIFYTRIVVVLLFLDSLLYNVEAWTQTFERVSPWRPILTATIYVLQPVILLVCMQITAPLKKKYFWVLIPEIISIPLCFTSEWTHLVAYFSEDNHYQGGALSDWPYIIFAFYVIVFIVQNLLFFKSGPTIDRVGLLYVILGAVLGTLLYWLRGYSGDYSPIFTSAILMYYLFVYIQMSKMDPLTKLLNRQCYYRDLELSESKITAVASIDMNDLKWWNDNNGHVAGDRALSEVARCISESGYKDRGVYRVGGDEFMILYFGAGEKDVRGDMFAMQKLLADTPYECAFGYALTDPEKTLEDVIAKSDRQMYEKKAAMKAKKEEEERLEQERLEQERLEQEALKNEGFEYEE